MKYRWDLAPAQPLLAQPLGRQTGVSLLMAQCLINRGFSQAEAVQTFLDPRLKNLADPFLLPQMDRAVDRLWQARDHGEPVVVFGDYDVDGVTSTALLLEVLGRLGWHVSGYLPSRMDEGYGLSRDGVENCLKAHPARLLLAVDCGSTAVETIDGMRAQGVEVVVLDHHQVSHPAPAAVALVNPQLAADDEPDFRELCSVGLSFKLAHALVKRGRAEGLAAAEALDVRPWLDLVALGTIADIVPLVGENRILVTAGLEWLDKTRRPGLVALKEVAGTASPAGVYEVGFQLGPRLNAAGRLETAEAALKLLQAETLEEAIPIAQALDARNRERQEVEQSILKEAAGAVRSRFDPERDLVIVEGRLLWHIGVVGIVASRILQEFYRPTLIIGGDGDHWRGSGRSIAGFDLAAALRECDDLLIRHGGHAMAAGLTVHPDRLDDLRTRLNEIARRTLKPLDLQPPLRLDAEVGLDEMTLSQLEELERLHPCGQGNPGVQLVARHLTHARALRRMGADGQHVKLWVTDGSATCEAVWWRAGDRSLPVGTFDLAFTPQINDYNGRRALQLKVLDWRPG
ncbi:MAG: single-stranded-DNA-specific exonuclease RecJ [Verrucomicrobia bacterium]|jgi:single-stranded-DNA-specific exonuclease|nr:single-stranded-DNA-specific exonuclease RecJ [Verrucomicrobiota bacterium]